MRVKRCPLLHLLLGGAWEKSDLSNLDLACSLLRPGLLGLAYLKCLERHYVGDAYKIEWLILLCISIWVALNGKIKYICLKLAFFFDCWQCPYDLKPLKHFRVPELYWWVTGNHWQMGLAPVPSPKIAADKIIFLNSFHGWMGDPIYNSLFSIHYCSLIVISQLNNLS